MMLNIKLHYFYTIIQIKYKINKNNFRMKDKTIKTSKHNNIKLQHKHFKIKCNRI